MAQNVKKINRANKIISVGLLVGLITFKGIELITSNLVHRWVFIKELFGLFLSQISFGEEG